MVIFFSHRQGEFTICDPNFEKRCLMSLVCRFVDDYANTIRALIDLYQVTFDVGHLEWALELQQRQNAQFWDPAGKGYFTSAEGDPTIVLRMKESQDGAEPNSNSVSALNLLRLHQMLDKPELMDMAKQTIAAFQETLARWEHIDFF